MEEYSLASQDSLLSFPCSSDLSLCGSRKQERLSSNNCMPSFSADPSLLHFCLCVDTGRNTGYKVILLDTGFLDREFFSVLCTDLVLVRTFAMLRKSTSYFRSEELSH